MWAKQSNIRYHLNSIETLLKRNQLNGILLVLADYAQEVVRLN